MTPEQQIFDVILNIVGLIFSSVLGVVFDVILVPLLEQFLAGLTGGTP